MIRLATAADLDGIEQIYNAIPWRIAAAREQAGVIHTLCIHPAQPDWAMPSPEPRNFSFRASSMRF